MYLMKWNECNTSNWGTGREKRGMLCWACCVFVCLCVCVCVCVRVRGERVRERKGRGETDRATNKHLVFAHAEVEGGCQSPVARVVRRPQRLHVGDNPNPGSACCSLRLPLQMQPWSGRTSAGSEAVISLRHAPARRAARALGLPNKRTPPSPSLAAQSVRGRPAPPCSWRAGPDV